MRNDDHMSGDPPVDGLEYGDVLQRAYRHVLSWRGSVADRPVFPAVTADELRDLLTGGGPPEAGTDAISTLDVLARAGELGSTASAGPRYFGYVIGSSLPVAVGADWLVTAWDQNATLYSCGPAVSVIEEVCADWLVKMLGLPPHTSAGFTTGTQMAAFTCLAAARHHLLARQGWDAEADGLWGAPRIPVIAGEQRHASIDRALRYLGMGTRVREVGCDADGAIDLSALRAELDRTDRPPIVCVQAGNINTGAVDPLREVCELVHDRGGWVHVDGAIGLWALASDEHRGLLDGAHLADSWTTDAHKWLNVPFDCGIAFVAHPDAHRAAVGITAAYLEASEHRDQINTVPDWSRRARSVPVYAVLRTLGRAGVAGLVDRNIEHAHRIAGLLAAEPGIEIVNEVVLNQVLVRFTAPGRDDDELTREVVSRVQDDGTCWLSGSVFGNRAVMRISICSAYTTAEDIRRSADAIIRCGRDAVAGRARATGTG
ncbi:glutamate/tyrosine decarboxylase-like PLP-dependent enzyme [Streptosporangium becharense]|uniref:Glutamate/tyrosine decarboxylase-like PLP-dependent enzyme n=1 Tax=Streptosporangium becharense TaxID=1816182 RepID=A0A7W9IMW0_9ACTN|nr:aminotransferase class V-fold PLP-dependent enzyme [Streptosporangium becharense]MBB2914299.1 glutamate/tyrosine decarboxylase-like PLP-dependent enzyme [Streptosporangium becharense]MBB5823669.1 glutamate/tyrosine decarboxylase-like PLP-dependent enzyme [Streptosporangium becharense]